MITRRVFEFNPIGLFDPVLRKTYEWVVNFVGEGE